MKNCDTKETPLHVALAEQELELTPDGRYVRWASTNPRHPRNWHPLRKAYDIGVIILLEFYTSVLLLAFEYCIIADIQHANSTAVSTSGVCYLQSHSLCMCTAIDVDRQQRQKMLDSNSESA